MLASRKGTAKQKKPPTYRLSKVLQAAIDPNGAVYTQSSRPDSIQIQVKKREVTVDGELPKLPEYLRDFAFRYAMENRSVSDWARLYHVGAPTISHWLARPAVLKYIMTIRYERRLQIAESFEQAEGKALRKLNEILDQDVTNANIQAILTTIFKTLSMTREGKVPSEPTESNFNLTLNQYSDNRQVTVEQEQQIQAQLEELDAVDRMLTRKHERIAVPVKPEDVKE